MQKIMHLLIGLALVGLVTGCAYFSGGADYLYEYQDGTGKVTKLSVHSTRKIQKGISLKMNPETGEIKLKAGGVESGENSNKYLFDFLKYIFQRPVPGIEVK